ncbi:MAG: hypothetical protein ACRDS9_07545 [Pseudonocardiaceae bacterium]
MSARPRANARVALVVVKASGELYTYPPGRRPTAGEIFWGSSGTMYEVDMGRHETSLEIILPSIGDASAFHATADVKWRVKEPNQIVSDGVTDVRATLRPPMQQRLGDITRKYHARAVEKAEMHARESLGAEDIGLEYGLETKIFLRLRMDKPFAEIDQGIEIETRRQALRVLQDQHTNELLTFRVGMYRTFIAAGNVGQFALQLARNPDDASAVVQALQEAERDDRRAAADFAKHMIDSGAVPRWQIQDSVHEVLLWLKESTDRAIGRRDMQVDIHPVEPPPIPPPRPGGQELPLRSELKSSLPRQAEAPTDTPGP